MPTTVDENREFSRLLHRALTIDAFFDAADRALAAVVPFELSCWLGLDPSTLLPTSHFTRDCSGHDDLMLLARNEFLEDDVNRFAVLARAVPPVGLLSEATGGNPGRSRRFREVLVPRGFAHGDELRAVFHDGGAAWGCVVLHRRVGSFTPAEVRLVADLGSGFLGPGIRRAVLLTARLTRPELDSPGLVLVASDGSIESVTPAAARSLAEIVDRTGGAVEPPLVVASLVARARSSAPSEEGEVATVRLPGRSGGWHVLHASLLDGVPDGRVGVMVHPERPPEVPGALATAYDLSPREAEVTGLVLQGCSTQEIAARLHLSPYTVQDHLKGVFAKVGVRSRRELVAQVFARHYAPRLAAGSPVDADGSFGTT